MGMTGLGLTLRILLGCSTDAVATSEIDVEVLAIRFEALSGERVIGPRSKRAAAKEKRKETTNSTIVPTIQTHPPPARNAVLARYRQLREISKRHHHDILKLISGDAMLQQARRLGLAQGRTLILDDMEEMSYVFDLAIYTAPPLVVEELRQH